MRRRRAAAEQRKRELRRRAPRQRWRHAAQLRERQGQCEASNRGRALLVQCMSSCSAIPQYSELSCHYISLQSCKMQCAISLVIQQCSLCNAEVQCMHAWKLSPLAASLPAETLGIRPGRSAVWLGSSCGNCHALQIINHILWPMAWHYCGHIIVMSALYQ